MFEHVEGQDGLERTLGRDCPIERVRPLEIACDVEVEPAFAGIDRQKVNDARAGGKAERPRGKGGRPRPAPDVEKRARGPGGDQGEDVAADLAVIGKPPRCIRDRRASRQGLSRCVGVPKGCRHIRLPPRLQSP